MPETACCVLVCLVFLHILSYLRAHPTPHKTGWDKFPNLRILEIRAKTAALNPEEILFLSNGTNHLEHIKLQMTVQKCKENTVAFSGLVKKHKKSLRTIIISGISETRFIKVFAPSISQCEVLEVLEVRLTREESNEFHLMDVGSLKREDVQAFIELYLPTGNRKMSEKEKEINKGENKKGIFKKWTTLKAISIPFMTELDEAYAMWGETKKWMKNTYENEMDYFLIGLGGGYGKVWWGSGQINEIISGNRNGLKWMLPEQ